MLIMRLKRHASVAHAVAALYILAPLSAMLTALLGAGLCLFWHHRGAGGALARFTILSWFVLAASALLVGAATVTPEWTLFDRLIGTALVAAVSLGFVLGSELLGSLIFGLLDPELRRIIRRWGPQRPILARMFNATAVVLTMIAVTVATLAYVFNALDVFSGIWFGYPEQSLARYLANAGIALAIMTGVGLLIYTLRVRRVALTWIASLAVAINVAWPLVMIAPLEAAVLTTAAAVTRDKTVDREAVLAGMNSRNPTFNPEALSAYWQRHLRAQPEDWQAGVALAISYQRMGQSTAALKALRLAYEHAPDKSEFREELHRLVSQTMPREDWVMLGYIAAVAAGHLSNPALEQHLANQYDPDFGGNAPVSYKDLIDGYMASVTGTETERSKQRLKLAAEAGLPVALEVLELVEIATDSKAAGESASARAQELRQRISRSLGIRGR